MKPLHYLKGIVVAAAIISIAFVSGCKKTPEPQKDKVKVVGTITDTEGNSIEKGKITVYTSGGETKEPERFDFDIEQGKLNYEVPKAEKYVVNIRVKGYGLVSKVFYKSIPERTYELKQATVVSFNPSLGGLIRDTKNNCANSLSARSDWNANPMRQIPLRINSMGQIAGFGMGAELQKAYDFHAKSKPCDNGGITVNIPANSLNTSATVNVAMSSIDLFSPDGMPGDYSLATGQQVGFMESFGAFSIDIYDDNEKNYNLDKEKKKSAIVTFPIPGYTSDNKDFPETIPVVYYDEMNGVWKKEIDAKLDRKNMVYVAEVTHFSAINLDLEKTNTSCLRFKDDQTDAITPTYKVEVTAPPTTSGGMPRVSSRDVTAADMNCVAPDDNQFALTRLPSDTEVSVVFFNTAVNPVPHGVYVFKTGPTDTDLNDPLRPACGELNKCGNFKLFTGNDFIMPSPEIFIAGCKNTAAGTLVVSIAIAPSVGVFNPASYKIKVSRSGVSVALDCSGMTGLLSTMTPTVDNTTTVPPPQVKMFQYTILLSSLCNNATNFPDEKVELVDTGNNVVSNAFNLVSCN